MQQFTIKVKNLILNGSIGLDFDEFYIAGWDKLTTGTMQIIMKITILNLFNDKPILY